MRLAASNFWAGQGRALRQWPLLPMQHPQYHESMAWALQHMMWLHAQLVGRPEEQHKNRDSKHRKLYTLPHP